MVKGEGDGETKGRTLILVMVKPKGRKLITPHAHAQRGVK